MSEQPKIRTRGRWWAYACAQLGGIVSIAANWAHSYVAPKNAPDGWAPEFGAVAFSIFWPVAVFFAVEAFARVPWPTGRRYVAIRFGGLLPVATVAAVVSYLHLSGLLRHYGASRFEANVGPLAIDGLMLIGTGALIATTNVGQGAALATVERAAEIEAAVTEALREESSRTQALMDEAAAQRASLESSLAAEEDRRRVDAAAAAEALRKVQQQLADAHREARREAPKKTPVRSAKAPGRAPRRTLQEWVDLAKERLPEWQMETPTGSVIGSALDLRSEGTISEIRKQLDADRVALTAKGGAQ